MLIYVANMDHNPVEHVSFFFKKTDKRATEASGRAASIRTFYLEVKLRLNE